LRAKVLDSIESEFATELAKLDKRNVELAKTLGRPRHKLS
jgi:hypothetical protein